MTLGERGGIPSMARTCAISAAPASVKKDSVESLRLTVTTIGCRRVRLRSRPPDYSPPLDPSPECPPRRRYRRWTYRTPSCRSLERRPGWLPASCEARRHLTPPLARRSGPAGPTALVPRCAVRGPDQGVPSSPCPPRPCEHYDRSEPMCPTPPQRTASRRQEEDTGAKTEDHPADSNADRARRPSIHPFSDQHLDGRWG